MTWESTVLALNPLVFCRLDHFPTDTVMTNIGTDPLQGELYQDGLTTFGFPSPIETDPASLALAGQAGFLLTADLPVSLDLNHTWIAWGYNDGSGAKSLICRNSMWSVSSSNILGFSAAHVAATRFAADNGSYSSLLTSAAVLGDLPIGWYMLTRVRNDTVGELYVNDQLVDSVSDIPTGTLAPYSSPNDKYAIGEVNGPTLGFFKSAGVDEAILLDYALNATQIRTVWESALLRLFMSAVSNVTPTAVLYSDVEPVPQSFPIRHNWADALIERITFRTATSTARKGYSENNQQRPKPRREIEIAQVLRDNTERTRLHAQLTAHQHRKWFIPILEDRETLIAPLAAGSTLLPATTQYRDYEVGGYVELRQLNALGQVVKQEQALITSLSPLTTTAIINSYDAFVSTIGPVRRGYVDQQQSLRGHTGAVEDTTLIARLVAEDEVVVPNRITPWTPDLTYKSHEVFNPLVWQSNDWTETRDYDLTRASEAIDYDTGPFTIESDAIASVETFSYRMLLDTRAAQAALLGWFYARAGVSSYLWVPTMQADSEIISVAGDDLTVSGHNYSDNFAGSEFRRDLAFVYHDNSMVLRRITTVATDGDNEVLGLDDAVPTLTNLRSVSYLRFCQLAGGTLEIARATDSVARFAWSFRELLSSPA